MAAAAYCLPTAIIEKVNPAMTPLNLESSRPALMSSGMVPYLPPDDERYAIIAVLIVLRFATAADSLADSRVPPRFLTTTPAPSSTGGRVGGAPCFGAVISIPARSDPETTIVEGDNSPETPAPISVGT